MKSDCSSTKNLGTHIKKHYPRYLVFLALVFGVIKLAFFGFSLIGPGNMFHASASWPSNISGFLDTDFWASSPSSGDIKERVFGPHSAYTQHWSNPGACDPNSIDIDIETRFAEAIRNGDIKSDTIYVIETDIFHTQPASLDNKSCVAIVGNTSGGEVRINSLNLSGTSIDSFVVDGIVFDNFDHNDRYAFNIYGGSSNLSFHNVQVLGYASYGIDLFGVSNVLLDSVQSYKHGGNGFSIQGSSFVTINNSMALFNRRYGFSFINSSNIVVNNSIAQNNGAGFYVNNSTENILFSRVSSVNNNNVFWGFWFSLSHASLILHDAIIGNNDKSFNDLTENNSSVTYYGTLSLESDVLPAEVTSGSWSDFDQFATWVLATYTFSADTIVNPWAFVDSDYTYVFDPSNYFHKWSWPGDFALEHPLEYLFGCKLPFQGQTWRWVEDGSDINLVPLWWAMNNPYSDTNKVIASAAERFTVCIATQTPYVTDIGSLQFSVDRASDGIAIETISYSVAGDLFPLISSQPLGDTIAVELTQDVGKKNLHFTFDHEADSFIKDMSFYYDPDVLALKSTLMAKYYGEDREFPEDLDSPLSCEMNGFEVLDTGDVARLYSLTENTIYYLLDGEYELSQGVSLPSCVMLVGESQDGVVIKHAQIDPDGAPFDSLLYAEVAIDEDLLQWIVLHNFTLDGEISWHSDITYPLFFSRVKHSVLDTLKIQWWQTNTYMQQSSYLGLVNLAISQSKSVGLYLSEVEYSTLKKLRMHNNAMYGLFWYYVYHTDISDIDVFANGDGMFLADSRYNTFVGLRIFSNEKNTIARTGIHVLNSSYNVFHNTQVVDNKSAGIILEEESNFNTFNNMLVANNEDGIAINYSKGNIFHRTHIYGNDNILAQMEDGRCGIRLRKATDNILHDVAIYNNRGHGIAVLDQESRLYYYGDLSLFGNTSGNIFTGEEDRQVFFQGVPTNDGCEDITSQAIQPNCAVYDFDRASGSLSELDTSMSCDRAIQIKNASWTNLYTNWNCATIGEISSRTGTTGMSYLYGENIMKQLAPVTWIYEETLRQLLDEAAYLPRQSFFAFIKTLWSTLTQYIVSKTYALPLANPLSLGKANLPRYICKHISDFGPYPDGLCDIEEVGYSTESSSLLFDDIEGALIGTSAINFSTQNSFGFPIIMQSVGATESSAIEIYLPKNVTIATDGSCSQEITTPTFAVRKELSFTHGTIVEAIQVWSADTGCSISFGTSVTLQVKSPDLLGKSSVEIWKSINKTNWTRIGKYPITDWKVIFSVDSFSWYIFGTPLATSTPGGWAWWWSMMVDNCLLPSTLPCANEQWKDYSPSYYDGTCCRASWVPAHGAAPFCDISNSSYSAETNQAFQRAYGLGITSMCPIASARLGDGIRRDETAKMMVSFATQVLKKEPDTSKKACTTFTDISHLNTEMQSYITLACQLGLMGYQADGSTIQKKFNPAYIINRAQFGTILSRLLYGNTYNINKWDAGRFERYQKHHLALKNNGIMTQINRPFDKEKRARVLIMLHRVFQNK